MNLNKLKTYENVLLILANIFNSIGSVCIIFVAVVFAIVSSSDYDPTLSEISFVFSSVLIFAILIQLANVIVSWIAYVKSRSLNNAWVITGLVLSVLFFNVLSIIAYISILVRKDKISE